VELAAYRVVQEALTNAVKYAAGRRTVVRVEYRAEEIEIVVDSVSAVAPVPAAAGGAAGEIDVPGGRGLTGLRERVGKLGGQLTAGPRDSGSFRVRALIPLGDKA
jgi:signal transduction histidine kinase